MDNCDPTNLPDVPDIPASIIESGIADQSLTSLVEAAMQKLIAAGVPIDRMNVGCRILHPLFDGMSITWTRGKGAEVEYAKLVDKEGSDFRLSPFFVMLSDGAAKWRLRLDRDEAVQRFPCQRCSSTEKMPSQLAVLALMSTMHLCSAHAGGLATALATHGRLRHI